MQTIQLGELMSRDNRLSHSFFIGAFWGILAALAPILVMALLRAAACSGREMSSGMLNSLLWVISSTGLITGSLVSLTVRLIGPHKQRRSGSISLRLALLATIPISGLSCWLSFLALFPPCTA
ncbi:MAG: hypothetical protein KDE09_18565 [Anaerolineales bacterium]|nr:hypothetical protein [Anaerolineales bacterium]